jgi:hypothetical protein
MTAIASSVAATKAAISFGFASRNFFVAKVTPIVPGPPYTSVDDRIAWTPGTASSRCRYGAVVKWQSISVLDSSAAMASGWPRLTSSASYF